MSAEISSIQRVILDFALRDRNDWTGLAALFAPGAEITIAWYSGPIEGFLTASAASAARGAPPPKHWFGVPRVNVRERRATAETDVQIMVRAGPAEAPVDVTSWARFVDRLECRHGRWLIVKRTAIYERDRMDAVDPSAPPGVSWQSLGAYPREYRHLSHLLAQVGLKLAENTIVAHSEAEKMLLDAANAWLECDELPR